MYENCKFYLELTSYTYGDSAQSPSFPYTHTHTHICTHTVATGGSPRLENNSVYPAHTHTQFSFTHTTAYMYFDSATERLTRLLQKLQTIYILAPTKSHLYLSTASCTEPPQTKFAHPALRKQKVLHPRITLHKHAGIHTGLFGQRFTKTYGSVDKISEQRYRPTSALPM